jgi:HlyD family secretion protein
VDAYPERNFEADITQVRYGSETTDNVVTYKTILNLENPDLLLRPGMTATADIIVQKMENVLLLPNAALRFTPPQKKEEKDSRGLIGKLFPGPPRRSRTVPATKTNHGKKQVWIYQNNQLEPVPVATGLSDGIHTVIHDSRLRAGMEVVVDATGEIR